MKRVTMPLDEYNNDLKQARRDGVKHGREWVVTLLDKAYELATTYNPHEAFLFLYENGEDLPLQKLCQIVGIDYVKELERMEIETQAHRDDSQYQYSECPF